MSYGLTGIEFSFDGFFETSYIPLLGHTLRRNVIVDHLRNNFLAHFLEQLRDIITGHQFVTLAINNRSLVVSHIVIFKQLLTYIEVAPLYLTLRLLNGARHHAMFDSLTVLHAKFTHEVFHTLARKNA